MFKIEVRIKEIEKRSQLQVKEGVQSRCCSVVLNCTLLHSIALHFNIGPNVQYFPILIWQKWTKNWTKVMFCGNQVPTKVTIKRD